MRVRFLKPFEWRPQNGVVIEYPGEGEHTVTRACAERAIEEGAAEPVGKQRKATKDSTDD